MNTLVISGQTATRMAVIASRTGSELMAGAKAMMIESLKEKLRNGVARFVFQKRNGEYRENPVEYSRSKINRSQTGEDLRDR